MHDRCPVTGPLTPQDPFLSADGGAASDALDGMSAHLGGVPQHWVAAISTLGLR